MNTERQEPTLHPARTILFVLTISLIGAFLITLLLKWLNGGSMLAWIVADSCLMLWLWIGLTVFDSGELRET